MPSDDDEKRLFDGLESFTESEDVPLGSTTIGLRTSAKRRSSLFDALPHSRSQKEDSKTVVEHEQSSTFFLDNSQMLPNAALNRAEYIEPALDKITRSPNASFINENEKLKAFNEIENSVMSPTGKTIMSFVNNFGSRPFCFQSPRKRSLSHNNSADSMTVNQSQSASNSKRLTSNHATENGRGLKDGQHWLEIPVIRDRFSFLDFSLRTTMLVECNLNLCFRSVMARHNARKDLEYWIFPPFPSDSSSDAASMSLEGNQRSNSSWVRGSLQTNLSHSAKQEVSEVLPDLGKRLINLVKGDKALFSSKRSGNIQRRGNTMHLWRWQEAIRSIFFKWCCSIKALLDGSEERMTASDIYFYCLAKDHVAIFRVDEIGDSHLTKQYVPRVILSDISSDFKLKLAQQGIQDIQYLQPSEGVAKYSPQENGSSAPMSPNVKAELEALRRAQALGEYAGADVRVKSDFKRVKRTSTVHADTPCSIYGLDNVSCFFEVYLNSYGQMQVVKAQQQCVPFLVCDAIGPFVHATLETVEFRPIKAMGTTSLLAFEGLITPNAFRSVVTIMTRELIEMGKMRSRQGFDDEESGRYMVIETDINTELSPVSKKFEESRTFNRWNVIINNESAENKVLEWEKGRCIKRLVWEAKSPEVLVCNFE